MKVKVKIRWAVKTLGSAAGTSFRFNIFGAFNFGSLGRGHLYHIRDQMPQLRLQAKSWQSINVMSLRFAYTNMKDFLFLFGNVGIRLRTSKSLNLLEFKQKHQ